MQTSRKPRVILFLLTALCGLFVFSYTSRLAQKSHLDAEIMAMEARIAEAETRQLKLIDEIDRQKQPDYIDRMARDLFGWVMPGDIRLVMVNQETQAARLASVAGTNATNPIDYRNFPVWQQWVVFFTADTFAITLQ